MDTKALETAEKALKVAVNEYETLVAAATDTTNQIADAKAKALTAAAALKQMRKEAIGSDIGTMLGSISTRGRKAGSPNKAQSAPGATAGKKGKK